ncbi:TniQ family protein [Paenibacillus sp. GbtcB18]|uniref:TniQ family protein n=1 Tax=Paenibacillus sp. GbtcB18 TaxID=2824763 RepID=UPI001C2FE011|nr:TniQ family protein [Paenibacillus sp. GbtcB18]
MFKLLSRPSPKLDESISSYLIRSAQSNRINPKYIYKLLSVYEDSRMHSFFLDTTVISEKDLNLLESILGFEGELLQQLFIVSFDESKIYYRYFNANVNMNSICTRKLKVCSLCLQEKNYIRKIWSLINLTSCPIHSCMLIDKCQKCSKSMTWWNSDIFRCSCGHEYKNSNLAAANEESLYLSMRIFTICGISTNHLLNTKYNEQFSVVINEMDFVSLNNSILLVSKFMCECKNISHFSGVNYNLEEFSTLQREAIKVFSDWPNNFYKFLEEVKVSTSNKKFNNIMGDFGNFYSDLFDARYDSLVLLRKGFINYLLDNFNSYSCSNLIRIINMHEELVISGIRAARYLNVSKEKLIRLIVNHEIEGQISKKALGINIITIKKSLEEYKSKQDAENQQILSYLEAQSYLDVGFGIDDIVKYGYLEYSYKEYDFSNAKYIKKQSVDVFIDNLRSRVTNQVTEESLIINFQKVVNIGQAHKHCSSGRLVQMILNEELLPCGVGAGIGLNVLLFNRMQVKDFFRRKFNESQGNNLRTISFFECDHAQERQSRSSSDGHGRRGHILGPC